MIVYCRIHCLLGMTVCSFERVDKRMFTAEICVALDHVSEAQLWLKQCKNVKKTLCIAVTRPEVIECL